MVMSQGQYSDMKHGVLFMELLRSHLGSQLCVSGHSQRRSGLRLDSKQTLSPRKRENCFVNVQAHSVTPFLLLPSTSSLGETSDLGPGEE